MQRGLKLCREALRAAYSSAIKSLTFLLVQEGRANCRMRLSLLRLYLQPHGHAMNASGAFKAAHGSTHGGDADKVTKTAWSLRPGSVSNLP
jgi:hypothetical protein